MSTHNITLADEIDARTGLKKKEPLSYMSALMIHLKFAIISNIYKTGYQIKSVGLIPGVLGIMFNAVIVWHVEHILIKLGRIARKQTGRRLSNVELGKFCFQNGPAFTRPLKNLAKIVGIVIIVSSMTGVLSSIIISFSETLKWAVEYLGYKGWTVKMWILVAMFPAIITSVGFEDLYSLSRLCTIANMLLFVTIYIMITAIKDFPKEFTFEWYSHYSKIPMSITYSVFIMSTVFVIMPIWIEIKNVNHMVSPFGIINVGLGIELLLSLTLGTLAYIKYGVDLEHHIVENMDKNIVTLFMAVCIAVALLFTYSLCVYITVVATFPVMADLWGPFQYPYLWLFLYKLGYISFTFTVTLLVPSLHKYTDFILALGFVSITYITPVLFHFVLTWEKSSKLTKCKDIAILTMGVVMFILIILNTLVEVSSLFL